MASYLGPQEILIAFWLTIIVILAKISMVSFLGVKLFRRRKETKLGFNDFLTGIFILIIFLTIAQVFYFYFDFFLTGFDTDIYLVFPNLLIYRVASCILGLGIGIFLIILDRSALSNKLKGTLGYINIAVAIINLFYPVVTKADFDMLSNIATIASLFALIIPIIFIWLAIKTPSIRSTSILLALGAILYSVSGMIFNEGVLSLFGSQIKTFIIILSLIIRIAGLIVLSLSANKLKL